MRNPTLLILITLLSLLSCVEKIDLTKSSKQLYLTIEGSISNQTGPYYVNVSYATTEFKNEVFFSKPTPIYNAEVRVIDETNNKDFPFSFNPISERYENQDFAGTEGHVYRLDVQIGDQLYSSESVEMLPSVPLDSAYLIYNIETELMEIFIDVTDPASSKNFFRWTWSGHREALTLTAPVEEVSCDPPVVECCSRCFVPISGKNVKVLDDQLYSGSTFNKVKIGEFTILRPNGYLIEIQQHNISDDAFDFWNSVSLQSESQGGLFDPPPFEIRGNIKNTSNPNQVVLGYFTVSGSDRKLIQFSGRPYSINRYTYDRVCDDCRWIPLADTAKPKNWIDAN